MYQLPVNTSEQTEFVDITRQVDQLVRQTGVDQGVCHIFVPHTTAAVTVNENADPDVARDVLMMLNRLVPFTDKGYRHSEGNSAAHVKAVLLGAWEVLPVVGGGLHLGRWQGVFFCEFDGPRSRKVSVQVTHGTR